MLFEIGVDPGVDKYVPTEEGKESNGFFFVAKSLFSFYSNVIDFFNILCREGEAYQPFHIS